MGTWRTALLLTVGFTLLTGVAYPAVVTLLAQLCFPHAASGSPVTEAGRVVGSEWIGQRWSDPCCCVGRPSAASGPEGDVLPSGGSNLGPTNPALVEAVAARVAALRALEPEGSRNPAAIPVDLVTASASGLDPHISVAAARWQSARVAAARGIDPGEVLAGIDACTERPLLGLFGRPRVHVLRLNLLLDRRMARR